MHSAQRGDSLTTRSLIIAPQRCCSHLFKRRSLNEPRRKHRELLQKLSQVDGNHRCQWKPSWDNFALSQVKLTLQRNGKWVSVDKVFVKLCLQYFCFGASLLQQKMKAISSFFLSVPKSWTAKVSITWGISAYIMFSYCAACASYCKSSFKNLLRPGSIID